MAVSGNDRTGDVGIAYSGSEIWLYSISSHRLIKGTDCVRLKERLRVTTFLFLTFLSRRITKL